MRFYERLNGHARQAIAMYKAFEQVNSQAPCFLESKRQFQDMAKGGDGGQLPHYCHENGETTCRGVNYPQYPINCEFFEIVCEAMGWA